MSAVLTGRTAACTGCGHTIEEFDRGGRVAWDHTWEGAAYDGGFHTAFPVAEPKPVTADDLRSALIEMVMRYGDACQREGVCFTRDAFEGKTVEHWSRARKRRFRAVQRLSAALRDAEVTR